MISVLHQQTHLENAHSLLSSSSLAIVFFASTTFILRIRSIGEINLFGKFKEPFFLSLVKLYELNSQNITLRYSKCPNTRNDGVNFFFFNCGKYGITWMWPARGCNSLMIDLLTHLKVSIWWHFKNITVKLSFFAYSCIVYSCQNSCIVYSSILYYTIPV